MPKKSSWHSVKEPVPPFVPEHEQMPGRKPAIGAQMLSSSPQVTAVEAALSEAPTAGGGGDEDTAGAGTVGAVVPGADDEHPEPADIEHLVPQW